MLVSGENTDSNNEPRIPANCIIRNLVPFALEFASGKTFEFKRLIF